MNYAINARKASNMKNTSYTSSTISTINTIIQSKHLKGQLWPRVSQ